MLSKYGKWFAFSIPYIIGCAFFSYLFYNVNDTNRYLDSLLASNYYQGAQITDYLVNKIDTELRDIVKQKVEKDDFYAAVAFGSASTRIDWGINLISVFATIFLFFIGFLVWKNFQLKEKAEEDIKRILQEAREKSNEMITRIEKEAQEKVRGIVKSGQEEMGKARENLEVAQETIQKLVLKTQQQEMISRMKIRSTSVRLEQLEKKAQSSLPNNKKDA
ncbi:MAG: hypothetical protein WC735_04805 [Candidatus Paceibacterota bacterium]|jgi:vacuolar-type H+-ATPase subunit H